MLYLQYLLHYRQGKMFCCFADAAAVFQIAVIELLQIIYCNFHPSAAAAVEFEWRSFIGYGTGDLICNVSMRYIYCTFEVTALEFFCASHIYNNCVGRRSCRSFRNALFFRIAAAQK